VLFLILDSADVKLSDHAFWFGFVGGAEFVRPIRFMEGYNPISGKDVPGEWPSNTHPDGREEAGPAVRENV
jgi:hypothetical protein